MCLQLVSHLKIASGNSAFFLILFPSQDIFYVIPICAENFQISISLTTGKSREEIAEKKCTVRYAQLPYQSELLLSSVS